MKRLGIFLIMAHLSLSGITQTSNGQTPVPDEKLRIGAVLIEQGKGNKKLVREYEVQIQNLQELNSNLEKGIQIRDSIMRVDEKLLKNKDEEILTWQATADTYKAEAEFYRKEYRKQRVKTFIVGLAGIAATISTWALMK